MRLFKKPIYRKILAIWCFKWINRYNQNKSTTKLLVYLECFLILINCYIVVPCIFVMYLGALFYRHKIFRKFHYKIGQEFHKIFHSKFHKAIGFFLIFIYVLSIIMILLMIFTIPFIILMYLGAKYEKKLEFPNKKRKEKYVYKYVDNERDKKESKTLGYIN